MEAQELNKHVYCTLCRHCKLDLEANTNCGFENECDSFDPEDSRPLKERPKYKDY